MQHALCCRRTRNEVRLADTILELPAPARALGRRPPSAKSALSEIMFNVIMMTCTVLVTPVVLMHAELFISSPTQALSGVEEVQNLPAQ